MTDNTNASVSAVPLPPSSAWGPKFQQVGKNKIKISTPDVMVYTLDDLDVDQIEDLLFESVGSQELITISRNDIVNGQDIKVQPIKNIKDLALAYNPRNIISAVDSSFSFFNNFPISLERYLPDQEDTALAEIDAEGNLVINLINISSDEQIEVQIFSGGNIFDDTIYGGASS